MSAAGRLWAAMKARDTGRVRARWPSAVVEEEAGRRSMASLGSRRAAALDAMALSRLILTRRLGLAPTELIWYQAYTACVVGDTSVMLHHLERLPRAGYAARVDLMLARLTDVTADTSLTARATAQLRPLAGHMVEADALLVALDRREAARAAQIVVPYADVVAAARSDGRLGTAARCIAGTGEDAEDAPPASKPTDPPTVRTLFGYLACLAAGAAGPRGALPDGLDRLRDLDPALLDDLIDRGALGPSAVLPSLPTEHPPLQPDRMPYLRCRLTPGEASEADLAATGFTAERARRAFLAQDRAALDALPDTDPAVRRYRALDAWRRTGRPERLDGLGPEAEPLAEGFDALRAAIAARPGEAQTVPEAVAADPSCWRLLTAEARAGSLRAGDAARHHPRFVEWLDIWRVAGLVLDGQWIQAAAEGDALAARAGTAAVRAEALNLAACARAEHGDTEGALTRLDEALDLTDRTALLVNASLVAAERRPIAALPYLTRIAQGTATATGGGPTAARENAVRAAIGCWQADKELDGCPPELTDLVRSALGDRVLDTELYRLLLTLTTAYDPMWLADGKAGVAASGPEQGALLNYYRTRARLMAPEHEVGLSDVAGVLVRLAQEDDAYSWVSDELRGVVNLLNEGVHCEFGTAVHLTPAIEVLLESGSLDPVPRLVLGAQAAAHLTVYLAGAGQDIDPAVEKRLLLAPCTDLLSGALDVPESMDEAVREELSRCLCVSAIRVLESTQRTVDDRADRWARLMDAQPAPTGRGTASFTRLLTGLLNDVDECTARLRAFIRLLTDLPQHESARQIAQLLTKAVLTWSAETTRLRSAVEGPAA
ncbi:hypothetical protein ACIPSA_18390 [Streptomyces sp. NPDC086549]|uniref:hypothetical protein n=1 Tax=Streptomyces sp. NPDC086549 TaxID=3365752 RepID=UPI00380C3340